MGNEHLPDLMGPFTIDVLEHVGKLKEELVRILLSVTKSFVTALPERVQEFCRCETRTLDRIVLYIRTLLNLALRIENNKHSSAAPLRTIHRPRRTYKDHLVSPLNRSIDYVDLRGSRFSRMG